MFKGNRLQTILTTPEMFLAVPTGVEALEVYDIFACSPKESSYTLLPALSNRQGQKILTLGVINEINRQ
jgi:hypothetical protein